MRLLPRVTTVVLCGILSAGAVGCAADASEDAASQEGAVSASADHGPYPIVLAHGFFGFDDFAGAETITYFYQVKDYLKAHGEQHVYTPAVDPFNDSEHRAARLLEHVHDILRETGAAKVNIIAHSQGGVDARLLAHDHPELIASVTTVSTPHQGTPIADAINGIVPDSGLLHSAVDTVLRIALRPLWQEISDETSFMAQLGNLSTEGMRQFNAKYTDSPKVRYFSIAGRSAMSLGEGECASADAPEFITRWKNTRDPMELLLRPTQFITDGKEDYVHDGLVRVRDAKWGTFLGCIPADHFDEIGQLFAPPAHDDDTWDHRKFYEDLIKYLRTRGF
jgi:triacylglycerol lipase